MYGVHHTPYRVHRIVYAVRGTPYALPTLSSSQNTPDQVPCTLLATEPCSSRPRPYVGIARTGTGSPACTNEYRVHSIVTEQPDHSSASRCRGRLCLENITTRVLSVHCIPRPKTNSQIVRVTFSLGMEASCTEHKVNSKQTNRFESNPKQLTATPGRTESERKYDATPGANGRVRMGNPPCCHGERWREMVLYMEGK